MTAPNTSLCIKQGPGHSVCFNEGNVVSFIINCWQYQDLIHPTRKTSTCLPFYGLILWHTTHLIRKYANDVLCGYFRYSWIHNAMTKMVFPWKRLAPFCAKPLMECSNLPHLACGIKPAKARLSCLKNIQCHFFINSHFSKQTWAVCEIKVIALCASMLSSMSAWAHCKKRKDLGCKNSFHDLL